MAYFSSILEIKELFKTEASARGLKGVLGIAPFRGVYEALLPIQQRLLGELAGERLDRLMEEGSVICLAYAFPEYVIDSIAVETGDGFDMEKWNVYAQEYDRLNSALDATAERIAEAVWGFAIPATPEVEVEIRKSEDYYPIAVSHRVAAEQSGIGWRGRNELIVNPTHSCAIRLASVITELPLERTPPLEGGCRDCRDCLNACPILANREKFDNYRDHCLGYMESLGLGRKVCGKCVKACVKSSIFHHDR
ncbi:MAG: epoxyqueuosine reductase [Candidatus Bathyarchaeota archaeon]|nr:MAG: epoxyqueuosine reductase [Candidatus Bathyarchaeota archaeon]